MSSPKSVRRFGARRLNLSIRTMLLAAAAVISCLLVFSFGRVSLEAWRAFADAESIERLDTGTNRFITGIYDILLERLVTNNALQAPNAADQETAGAIAANRKTVRENYDSGLALLKTDDFPNKPALIDALTAASAKAAQIRTEADRALTQTRNDRNNDLRKAYAAVMTDWANAALGVWFIAVHHAGASDPMLARLATIKELGWRLRDLAGQERAILAQAIAADAPLELEQIAQNVATRHQIDRFIAKVRAG